MIQVIPSANICASTSHKIFSNSKLNFHYTLWKKPLSYKSSWKKTLTHPQSSLSSRLAQGRPYPLCIFLFLISIVTHIVLTGVSHFLRAAIIINPIGHKTSVVVQI